MAFGYCGLQVCNAGGYFFGFRRQRFGPFCACERSVFGRFGTRFRWCSAFSAPLPTHSLLCLFRVGCATVQGPAAAAFSLSLEGSVGNVRPFLRLRTERFWSFWDQI